MFLLRALYTYATVGMNYFLVSEGGVVDNSRSIKTRSQPRGVGFLFLWLYYFIASGNSIS